MMHGDTVALQLGRQILRILELQSQIEQQNQTITAQAAEIEKLKQPVEQTE